jgi:phosphoadenosine phosphosulfate reductase
MADVMPREREWIVSTPVRASPADAVRLNRTFAARDTREHARSAAAIGLAGEVAVVSSFGAESAVLLHLIARSTPPPRCCSSKPASIFPKRWPIATCWSSGWG